jgi:hypothetical protein
MRRRVRVAVPRGRKRTVACRRQSVRRARREPEPAADGAQLGERHITELLGPSMAVALRARLRRFKTALPF